MRDPVHLLAPSASRFALQFGLRRLFKRIQGVSARVLRLECPPLTSRTRSLWTDRSFVSPVGAAPLAVIKRYLENPQQVC